MNITKLNDNFSVSPQIQYDDVDALSKQGYRAIINHRPDSEDSSQPLSKALAKAAKMANIDYHHIPFKPGQATAADKEQFKHIIDNTDGPVLAFCRSGMRARALYKTVIGGGGFFSRLFDR